MVNQNCWKVHIDHCHFIVVDSTTTDQRCSLRSLYQALLWVVNHGVVSPSMHGGLERWPVSCCLCPRPFARLKFSLRLQSIYNWPQSAMVTVCLVEPFWEPTFSMAWTTSRPSTTWPKTTCLPSNQEVLTVQMKNWEPLVPARLISSRTSRHGTVF